MKVLLSSIGSRGDVQPLLALAVELRALGHEASLCVAPNFKDWVESYGFTCIPIGPDLKKLTGGTAPSNPVRPTAEQMRQSAADMVRYQFQVVSDAAPGFDLIVGGGALQMATRSVAEALGIPYVFAAYCPVVLPSPAHPPLQFRPQDTPAPAADNLALWEADGQRWNELFGVALNEERAKAGLAPIPNIQRYVFTDSPWLAADPVLGPAAPAAPGMTIIQTGAWLLSDPAPLPEEVEHFLANGEPPIYLGFGSMRAQEHTGRLLVEAARSLGRRSIILQGWADLRLDDAGPDYLLVGEVSHERLFGRVAAIVHHGGSGTTTTAARAGKPQVVVPHNYDQFYWAQRVETLGVGGEGRTSERLTLDALVAALRDCLRPEVVARAQALAGRIEPHGARIAAQRLVAEFG